MSKGTDYFKAIEGMKWTNQNYKFIFSSFHISHGFDVNSSFLFKDCIDHIEFGCMYYLKKLTYELIHVAQRHIRKVHVPHVLVHDDVRIHRFFHIRNVKIELGLDLLFHKLLISPKTKHRWRFLTTFFLFYSFFLFVDLVNIKKCIPVHN